MNGYGSKNQSNQLIKVLIFVLLLIVISSNILLFSSNGGSNSSTANNGYELHTIRNKGKNKPILSSRLKSLLEGSKTSKTSKLVGDNLHSIKNGSNTIKDILQPSKESKEIYTMEDIIDYFTEFLQALHATIEKNKKSLKGIIDIWDLYYNLDEETLYPWDQKFLSFLKQHFYHNSTKNPFQRRDDDSIFLSIATYRDENCMSTLHNAFDKAKTPEKLFIGLVQQNCAENCFSGVLVGGMVEPIEPDDDCYAIFCKDHADLCDNVRVLYVNETESLGPYTARYFASRLWYGETWFVQLDSHMTFARHWDAHVIKMLKNAPSEKPVITHYPPSYETNLDDNINNEAQRLCGPVISESPIDDEIIIMMFSSTERGNAATDIPKFAPVIAAGFFASTPEFLIDVPFDMFLPWTFTGEEIIMSARFFTHGYDIFAPTRNIIGHIYERRHKPKFWEVFDHIFGRINYYNPLSRVIMKRIKHILEYPESAKDFIAPSTILAHVEDYTLGGKRSLKSYLEMATIDLTYKFTRNPDWCNKGIIDNVILQL